MNVVIEIAWVQHKFLAPSFRGYFEFLPILYPYTSDLVLLSICFSQVVVQNCSRILTLV